jgi:hypothetical protein
MKIGDKLLIISDRVGNKLLANVSKGEIVEVTGISENGKIIYHNNSLALPANSTIYKIIKNGEII